MGTVLVIDDDEMFCEMMCRYLKYMNHDASYALTLEGGFAALRRGRFDVVLLDVQLPDANGLAAIAEVRDIPPLPEVIIITGQGDPDGAELAIKSGAWAYLEKPVSLKETALQLTRVFQYRKERSATAPVVALQRSDIIGESRAIKQCFSLVARAAAGDANVLITGETGTGKELFSKAIHENSRRADGPFVVVDCTAIPDTLAESVLFGHAKGAYTGADKSTPGLVKQANGGTLFLDELGELPLSMQKVFLRVIQEHRFRPVGGEQEEVSDFRLVAATNQDLDAMASAGQFRQDLLYRIRSLSLHLPPLRERREDIRHIVLHHLTRLCERDRIAIKGFSPDFFEALEAYHWPGNVRELLNTFENTLAAASSEHTLFARHLPLHLRVLMARNAIHGGGSERTQPDIPADAGSIRHTLREFRRIAVQEAERQYLTELVTGTGGDVKEACRISGLSRSRLYEMLKVYQMSMPR